MFKIKIISILFFASVCTVAQTIRNYSNEFLNIGIDARSLSMSKAVVANTNDVNAGYWNIGGLVGVKDYQGALMHASYFAGIANFNYVGFAMPVDTISAVNFSFVRFSVDDILNTTELIDSNGNIDYNRISLFSTTDYAFNIGYARMLAIKGLSVGGNAKIVRRVIGDFASSWGFGFDVGIQYKYNAWEFGLMLRDATNTFNMWNINKSELNKIKDAIPGKNNELPETTEITKPKLQIGVAKKYTIGKYFGLLTEIDLNMRFAKTNDIIASNFVSIDPAIGFELDYENTAFLRAGAGNFQKITEFDNSKSLSVQPNFGIGFKYKGIQIDYALTNIGSVSNVKYSNIFSIKFDYSFFR